jgi:hypothetical protein
MHSDSPKPKNPDQELYDQLPQTTYGEQKEFSLGKLTVQMFPEGYIALNKELATDLHPKLVALLANHPADEVDIRLMEICTYCSIAVDGEYTLAERDKLCFILAGRLEALRELPSLQIVIQ